MSGGGIPQFFVPNIHPQVVDQGGAPDFWSAVLGGLQPGMQAGLTGYKEQQQNSRSSAENEIRKAELAIQQQHFKLLQEQEKTKQAEHAHTLEVAKATGEAYNQFLQHLLPHAASTGQLGGLLGQSGQQSQPQDQFGIPQGLPWQQAKGQLSGLPQAPAQSVQQPAPQSTPSPLIASPQAQNPNTGVSDPFQALASVLPSLPSEAIPMLMQHIEPMLALLKKEEKPTVQQVDTGKYKTTFDPNKGYWNPDSNKWQPSLPKGYTTDELEKQRQDRELRQAQIDATVAYREDIQSRSLSARFDSRTKDLRDRGRMLQQAALTIGDAQNAPTEAQRKVLTSSAIANFVQAADQKANLRYQMLQYFKRNVDPSLVGGLSNAAQLLATGQYPPEIYQGLARHINRLLEQSKSEFQKQRAAEVKRHPGLVGYLPEADEFFTNEVSNAPPIGGPIIR